MDKKENKKIIDTPIVPRYYWGAIIGAVGNIASSAIGNSKNKKQQDALAQTPQSMGVTQQPYNFQQANYGISAPNLNIQQAVNSENQSLNTSGWRQMWNGMSDSFKSDGTGVGGVMQTATSAMGAINPSGANTSQKQMQRADSIVDGVSAAVSVIPGFGTAVGAGIQLVNRFGGAFVKKPQFMKDFKVNDNVMQNAAAFGGVASNVVGAGDTARTYSKSGLAGKLVGRNNTTRNLFAKAMDQQTSTQGVLDVNKEARENMVGGADLAASRVAMNQMGNIWNRGGITFGKTGMKFQGRLEDRQIKPKKTKEPTYKESVVSGGVNTVIKKKSKIKCLRKDASIKNNKSSRMDAVKEAVSKHQFGGQAIASNTRNAPTAKSNRPATKAPIVKSTTTTVAPAKVSGVTESEQDLWNGFVDYVDQKGYKGSTELDNRNQNLSRSLWNDYSRSIGSELKYDEFIPRVQTSIEDYRNRAIERIKNGQATLNNYSTDEVNSQDFDWDKNFMKDLSVVDGWAGSKTTSWKFPVNMTKAKQVRMNKDGGAINVIVEGKLHAHKHDMKSIEGLENAKITHKGVPVIMKEGGEVEQAAEVEKEELILHYDLTKKLEQLMEEGTDEAAIEAGKLLAKELTSNIDDRAGILEKFTEDVNS